MAACSRMNSEPPETAIDARVAPSSAGVPRTEPRLARGLEWLRGHQDPQTGSWVASSLNKKRPPEADPAKFMSDAATAYAVLSLTFEPPRK